MHFLVLIEVQLRELRELVRELVTRNLQQDLHALSCKRPMCCAYYDACVTVLQHASLARMDRRIQIGRGQLGSTSCYGSNHPSFFAR